MRMTKRISVAVIALTTSAVLLQGAGAAHAADLPAIRSNSPSEVMTDVNNAVASTGEPPAVKRKTGTEGTQEARTALPTTADQASETVAGTDTLTMRVPGQGKDLVPGDEGTSLFEGTDKDTAVAVQATEGGVRSLVHINSARASERFEFTVGGDVASLRLTPEGGAEALDAQGRTIAIASTPWAIDAKGTAVPTHYEINGTTLIQVVEHRGEGYTYDIVADPGWLFYSKCSLAIAQFVAENTAIIGKFFRVFKSKSALLALFKSLEDMNKASRRTYFLNKLGDLAMGASGLDDLISRCIP